MLDLTLLLAAKRIVELEQKVYELQVELSLGSSLNVPESKPKESGRLNDNNK